MPYPKLNCSSQGHIPYIVYYIGVPFSLPSGETTNAHFFSESAEIVSIDAFNGPEPSKGLVVGISLILLKVCATVVL